MASRTTTTTTEAKSSKNNNSANKANNSGNGKKLKPSGTVVKSRYMQSAEKTFLSKSNSTNESFAAPQRPSSPRPSGVRPKVGTPPRRSMTPQALATSMASRETDTILMGKSVLQSTFSDGHCFRPDFDISVIREKTVIEKTPETETKNSEEEKKEIEMQTFLLAYLTAKMEHSTAKLKAEAEAKLLKIMEEEETLRKEVQVKKRQFLLNEKRHLVNELLDLQIAALTPVAESAKQFTKDYKSLATAVDTTRHQLPVKNFYIEENRREFLDKAEDCLKESEKLLLECTEGGYEDNSITLECLKNLKKASNNISHEVLGTFSDLLDLSSLSFRHTTHVQQNLEEEQLGTERTLELYIHKQ